MSHEAQRDFISNTAFYNIAFPSSKTKTKNKIFPIEFCAITGREKRDNRSPRYEIKYTRNTNFIL